MHQLVFKIFLDQFYFSSPEFCCRIHFLYNIMCLKNVVGCGLATLLPSDSVASRNIGYAIFHFYIQPDYMDQLYF